MCKPSRQPCTLNCRCSSYQGCFMRNGRAIQPAYELQRCQEAALHVCEDISQLLADIAMGLNAIVSKLQRTCLGRPANCPSAMPFVTFCWCGDLAQNLSSSRDYGARSQEEAKILAAWLSSILQIEGHSQYCTSSQPLTVVVHGYHQQERWNSCNCKAVITGLF